MIINIHDQLANAIPNMYDNLKDTFVELKTASIDACKWLKHTYERKQTEELRSNIIDVVHKKDSFQLKYILDLHLDDEAICNPGELFDALICSTDEPFDDDQLKMAKILLKREADLFNPAWFLEDSWVRKAIENQDLPLLKLLAASASKGIAQNICKFLLDHNERDFLEETLKYVSKERCFFYLEVLFSKEIDSVNIEKIQYLANLDSAKKFLEIEHTVFFRALEKSHNTRNFNVIQTLIDAADKIPVRLLGDLTERDDRELFDQVIQKASWDDYSAIDVALEEIALMRQNPNDPLLIQYAYYLEQFEKHFGPKEQCPR